MYITSKHTRNQIYQHRHATRGNGVGCGGGGGLACTFLKIKKGALIFWGKKALIVSIVSLNLP